MEELETAIRVLVALFRGDRSVGHLLFLGLPFFPLLADGVSGRPRRSVSMLGVQRDGDVADAVPDSGRTGDRLPVFPLIGLSPEQSLRRSACQRDRKRICPPSLLLARSVMHSRPSFGSGDDARIAPFPDSRPLLKVSHADQGPGNGGAQGAMLALLGPRTS